MSFYAYEDLEDCYDKSLHHDEDYDERHEGLTIYEIADLKEDAKNKEAYESMILDSYCW